MKTTRFFLLFFVLFSPIIWGQELQLPPLNQYLADSEFLLSPTYAGIGNMVKIRASGVTQWVGIKNSPTYQSLSADMRIGFRDGIGVLFYNDKNGNTHQAGGKFSYSHHLTIDAYQNHFVSLGISYLLNTFRINTKNFSDYSDPFITDNRSTINHNFEVGVLYRHKNMFIGLAISNLLNKINHNFAINEPKNLRNYNFRIGFRFKENRNSNLEIEPSLFTQLFENDRRSTTDINLKFRWFDKNYDYYWAGINYRTITEQYIKPLSFSPMVGFKKSVFYFSYGYQLNLNELQRYHSGTHMVTIGLDIFQGIGGCNCLEK